MSKLKIQTIESDVDSDDNDVVEDRVGASLSSRAGPAYLTTHSNDIVKKMLGKAVITADFDEKPLEDVKFKSAREIRRIRKAERESTKGNKWFNLPATEVDDETKRDLELLQMRASLNPTNHYRRHDLKTIPKYFQKGRVVDNSADFYSSRLTKRERKQNMVEELINDHELLAKNKKRYNEAKQREVRRRRRMNPMKRKKR